MHVVTVSPFSIAIFPVSVEEYAVFLKATGHPSPVGWGEPRFDQPDLPVCGVSWFDAVAYADWLSAKTGVRYGLPNEAQREYAARGGRNGETYPWGDEPLPLVHHYARGLSGPLTGGPFPLGEPSAAGPNGFGLYHMADNVHEWCADFYDAGYYAVSPAIDPAGPASGERRVARGGAWRHDVKYSRCAARSSLAPGKRFADFGFRLVGPA